MLFFAMDNACTLKPQFVFVVLFSYVFFGKRMRLQCDNACTLLFFFFGMRLQCEDACTLSMSFFFIIFLLFFYIGLSLNRASTERGKSIDLSLTRASTEHAAIER
jgi:hypothetical protein